MARCIIIPADPDRPLNRADLSGLADFQQAVGGWIEQVTISERSALIVDEDGRSKQLRINRRATLLLRLFVPAARISPGIVGDVVLVGAPTRESFGDVPDELDRLLIETHRFIVRASTGAKEMRSNPFDDFWNASELAIVADLDDTLKEIEVIAYE